MRAAAAAAGARWHGLGSREMTLNRATSARFTKMYHASEIAWKGFAAGHRGAGDSDTRAATRAPVEDRIAEAGVYVPSLRARHSARRPQSPERLERKGNQRWSA
jgi:hypothetical protein